MASLGQGEWNEPQLDALLLATASGLAAVEGYQMELRQEGRPAKCPLINAQRVDYPGKAGELVLLSVTDITGPQSWLAGTDPLIMSLSAKLHATFSSPS